MDKKVCRNVTGINNHEKQLDVKKFLNMKSDDLVSLLKTKVKAANMESFTRNCLRFTSNSAAHKGGHIVIAWNPNSFQVNIVTATSQLMHCVVSVGNFSFCCNFLYDFHYAEERNMVCHDVEMITHKVQLDSNGRFNCVMRPHEKIGSLVRR